MSGDICELCGGIQGDEILQDERFIDGHCRSCSPRRYLDHDLAALRAENEEMRKAFFGHWSTLHLAQKDFERIKAENEAMCRTTERLTQSVNEGLVEIKALKSSNERLVQIVNAARDLTCHSAGFCAGRSMHCIDVDQSEYNYLERLLKEYDAANPTR